MSTRLQTMVAIMKGDAEMFEMYFLRDLPTVLPALLAAEDHRGTQHRGIDYWSILRVVARLPFGGQLRGLSTIEQQYARTIERRKGSLVLCKLRELWWSHQLGRHLTKKEIWCGYLWRAYFGAYMTGYAAAREIFAPSPIPSPSRDQAAGIVACLKYPRPKMPSAAWEARHKHRVAYILRRMDAAKAAINRTAIT